MDRKLLKTHRKKVRTLLKEVSYTPADFIRMSFIAMMWVALGVAAFVIVVRLEYLWAYQETGHKISSTLNRVAELYAPGKDPAQSFKPPKAGYFNQAELSEVGPLDRARLQEVGLENVRGQKRKLGPHEWEIRFIRHAQTADENQE